MLQSHTHKLIIFLDGFDGAAKKFATTKPILKKIAINKKIIIDKYSDKKL